MASTRAPAKRATTAAKAAPRKRAASASPNGSEIERLVSSAAATVTRAAMGAQVARGPQVEMGVSTNLTAELNNIDFRKMIGGPLQAAVDAQVASSMATVNFIKSVGFVQKLDSSGNPDGFPELVMVDFTHTRKDVDPKTGVETDNDTHVKVPLLAMLPIPSLRIEHVIIDFNVKLNSVESSSTSDELGVKAEVGGGWGPVNFKVSASYQRKTATNVEVKKEYSLNVNVKAVQDEIPAGLEKILGMLSA